MSKRLQDVKTVTEVATLRATPFSSTKNKAHAKGLAGGKFEKGVAGIARWQIQKATKNERRNCTLIGVRLKWSAGEKNAEIAGSPSF